MYLYYNAIYLAKLPWTLLDKLCALFQPKQWAMYIGRDAPTFQNNTSLVAPELIEPSELTNVGVVF